MTVDLDQTIRTTHKPMVPVEHGSCWTPRSIHINPPNSLIDARRRTPAGSARNKGKTGGGEEQRPTE